MYYDFARPYTLIHEYDENQFIKARGGKDKGMIEMDGTQWRPYSPETFLRPHFKAMSQGTAPSVAGVLRL